MWLQLRHQFGHMFAGLARLQGALLLRLLRRDCFGGVIALSGSWHDWARTRTADFYGHFLAGRLWCELGDRLLVDAAPLDRPVGALLAGGVPAGDVITFSFHVACALGNIILYLMLMLDSLTFALVLCRADNRSIHTTILHQFLPANLYCCIVGSW